MAKKQRTMRDMFLRNESHVDGSNESLTNTSNTKEELTEVEAARLAWKDAWYSQFHWIEFNLDLGRVFFIKFVEKNKPKLCLQKPVQ